MRAATETPMAIVVLLILGVVWSGGVQAEKADRSSPIQIEADRVRLDDLKRISVYEGNVVLTQGTLVVKADRVDVHQDKAGMTFGEATGNPVSFRQKVEGRDEYLEARANRLEYDTASEVVKLSGGAHLKRGGDELRGAVITYSMRSEVYQALGSAQAGTPGRVRAVIQPRPASGQDDAVTAPGAAAARP